jgi:hypothetical protein
MTESAVEQWFKSHGVPQFAGNYSGRDRLGLVVFVLLSVVAFELGAAPWYEPNALQLLLALVGVMCLTLCLRPMLGALLEPHPPAFAWWSVAARVAIIVAAAWLLRVDRFVGEHPEVAVTFPLLMLTAASAAALSSRSLWGAVLRDRPQAGMVLVNALCFTIVAFAFEGTVLPPVGDDLRALAALTAMLLVFVTVILLFRGCTRVEESDCEPDPRLAFAFPGASLLTMWLGLQTAVLTYTPIDRVEQVLLSLTVVGVVLLVGRTRARRNIRSGPGGRVQVFPLFAALFVVAYPALVAAYFQLDFGTEFPVTGAQAFALGVGFHALFVLVAIGVVRLGLDRVVAWAGHEALANLGSVINGISRGLPLLVIVTVFLLMQAELWQVAFLTRWVPFLALVSGMVVVGFLVMLTSSSQQLDGQVAFGKWATNWEAVARAARCGSTSWKPSDPPVQHEIERFKTEPRCIPDAPLSRKQRLNAVLVIAVYQAIIFLPLAAIAAVVFWGLTRLSVPQHVAAEWIYGDKPTDDNVAAVSAPALLAEPWARLAMLLAAFSFLSLAVQIPANKEQRKDFLAGADSGIKQRLAALLVHRALDEAPERGADEGSEPAAPIAA